MAIEIKIKGFKNFPPSKNQLYWGKAVKNRWIKHFQREFQKEIEKIQNYRWVRLIVVFELSESRFKRFEIQNYIETICDALFGYHKDHRIVEIKALKQLGEQNKLIIKVEPFQV